MKKQSKRINRKIREKLLERSSEPGCVITELARSYGVRPALIYRWRTKARRKEKALPVASRNNFVEVKLSDTVEEKKVIVEKKVRKASLEFEEFTLSIRNCFGSNSSENPI